MSEAAAQANAATGEGGAFGALPRPRGAVPPRRAGWGRRVGTVCFWAVVQGICLTPVSLSPYRPLVPPPLGALLNLAVAAGFAWWFVRRPVARRDWRRLATFRVRPAGAAWPWVGAVVVAILALTPAGLLVSARALTPPPDDTSLIQQYARLPGGGLALLTLVAVVAPLLEEFLFRGWMQRSLERRFVRATPDDRALGAWRAILVTSVTFAAVHAETFGFPLRFTLAVASGYAAWTTKSIWPSVVLHGAYNAWAMALGAVLPIESSRDLARLARVDSVFWPALAGLVASVVLLVWTLRRMAAAARAGRAT